MSLGEVTYKCVYTALYGFQVRINSSGSMPIFPILNKRFFKYLSQGMGFLTFKRENYLHKCYFDLSGISEANPNSIYPWFIVNLLFIKHFIYGRHWGNPEVTQIGKILVSLNLFNEERQIMV